MPDSTNSSAVVGYLCQWFAAAVLRLQGIEEEDPFVRSMLGCLEERLLALPASDEGRDQALTYIYGLHVTHCQKRQDWHRLVELAVRARAVIPRDSPSRAFNEIALGDALVKLGSVDQAANAYLSGLKDQSSFPGTRPGFLLLLSHVVPTITDQVFQTVSEVVTTSEYLQLPDLARGRSEASAQMRSAAFRLDPTLQSSALAEPR